MHLKFFRQLLWWIVALPLMGIMVAYVWTANTALWVLCLVLAWCLLRELYWRNALHRWLNKPTLANLPNGGGGWEDIFTALYQEFRRTSQSHSQLSGTLTRFQHVARALPDGVVILASDNTIIWCNPLAETNLSLNLAQDEGQPIHHLLRHNEFLKYLQQEVYAEPLKLNVWNHKDLRLELQIVPFEKRQKLLICRDITHLERVETMRRDFIADVSHELRTPLTVVNGYLETLLELDSGLSATSRQYLRSMHDHATRMHRLVEDLLTLSRIENNLKPPNDAEIDMSVLMQRTLSDAEVLSQGRHTLSLKADDTLDLLGAEDELASAFANLITNAIGYTECGGSVYIFWGVQEGVATFYVQDTGIGIENEHIARLTERFYRVDQGRSRATGGTGLGLSIVKHILIRHSASLHISSVLGQGSTFKISFPATRMICRQGQLL